MINMKKVTLSKVALFISLLPALTFVSVLLHVNMPANFQIPVSAVNVTATLIGLLLSAICVKDTESRSIVNVTAICISLIWFFIMASIVILAIIFNIL